MVFLDNVLFKRWASYNSEHETKDAIVLRESTLLELWPGGSWLYLCNDTRVSSYQPIRRSVIRWQRDRVVEFRGGSTVMGDGHVINVSEGRKVWAEKPGGNSSNQTSGVLLRGRC